MGGGMEIITGVERRRRWRPEEKLRILAELDEPGAKFADVARRHEVSRGLLWQWRDAQRRGVLVVEEPVFLPLRIVPELPSPEPPPGATSAPSAPPAEPDTEADNRIEIVLPDGTAVRVTESISTTALRRVLAALRA
jgi:transposase